MIPIPKLPLELEWSVDGTTWNNVVPQPVYVGLDQWYVASNWNIAGGNAILPGRELLWSCADQSYRNR
jgi:hypothetical protein